MFNPASIPDMFSELVAQVSTTLGYTVNYKFGTWKVINDELKNTQNDKFPLIALLRGWRETPEDDVTMLVEGMKILIAVKSGETDQEQERNDNSYLSVIFPIYKALCEVIADSYFFTGYNQNFKHSVRDWPNIGLENGERLLEDCSDGRLLENIALRVNMNSCFYPKSVCYYTPCPNGRVTSAITLFDEVVISGLSTSELLITVTDYTYKVEPPTLPAPFIPTIDPGTGAPSVSMEPDLTYVLDVSALSNGFYLANIRFGSAMVSFYYNVAGGVIVQHTSLVRQVLTPNFDCQNYFDTNNYGLAVSLTYQMSRVDGQPKLLNAFRLDCFGVTYPTTSFPVADSYTGTTDVVTKFNEGNYLVDQQISYSGQAPLQNIAYIKTKCSN